MPGPTPTSPPAAEAPDAMTASIVTMVGKGMTARAILRLFPHLTPGDIRGALLKAAEVVRDEDASLLTATSASTIAAEMRAASDLDEDEAMALAVEETRAARSERGAGPRERG